VNVLRGRHWIAAAVASAALTACSEAPTTPADADSTRSPTAPTETTGAPQERVEPDPTDPPHAVSLPALFDRRFTGGGLRLVREVLRTDAYASYSVTYRSERLRISGVLNVPHGPGPFPALVLAHGYIDPAYYANGQGMRREQDWLARAGYVVLHTDYRNHAGSSKDPHAERRMRLGYTVDAINAVNALRATARALVDDERIGLVGRSMGGGVVYNVLTVAPGLVDAAVVFAPVSSWTPDNFDRWVRDDPGRSALSDFILDEYGDPRTAPAFWRGISPRTYFDRVTEPVLIHHGTSDDSCPLVWSRRSTRALTRAGVDVRLEIYPGEEHAFGPQWPLSMRRTTAFLDRRLRP